MLRSERCRCVLVAAVALSFLIVVAPDARAAAGDLDTSFAGDGWLETTIFHQANGTGVAIQPDGNIVVSITSLWHSLFAVARFLPDGTLDPAFGSGGHVRTDFNADSHAQDVLLQPDGRIVVAGTTGRRIVVVRYLSDGTLDATFDGDGIATVRFPHQRARVAAAALTPDGAIVLAGSAQRGGRRSRLAVVRLTASGGLDSAFSGDGKVILSMGRCDWCSAEDVDIDEGGTIVAVGGSDERSAIVMLDDDGNLVTSFSRDGIRVTSFGSNRQAVNATAVSFTPTGRVLVGAWTSGFYHPAGLLAQLRMNGRLDVEFSGNGRAAIPIRGPSTIGFQADGKILVAGYLCCGGGSELFFALGRLEPTAARDLSFGDEGYVFDFSLSNGGWLGMALQTDGRIVVTGGLEISGAVVVARYLN